MTIENSSTQENHKGTVDFDFSIPGISHRDLLFIHYFINHNEDRYWFLKFARDLWTINVFGLG